MYRPSRTAKREFAKKMNEIETFCCEHGIISSRNNDSYYFNINGTNYRVSNHTVESSNSRAFNAAGEQVREIYHNLGREDNTVYIHASKTRVIEIYNDIVNGYELDGKGRRK